MATQKQFEFLGKTYNSISFRHYVTPYIINQKEVDDYNALVDKTGVKPVEPITCDYVDYGVMDKKVITNQAEIDAQLNSFFTMTDEEIANTPKIEPIYEDKNDFTTYFGNLTSYDGIAFENACNNYLASI